VVVGLTPVGISGVPVGATGVSVGATGVSVGVTGVSVGATGVSVGLGTGISVTLQPPHTVVVMVRMVVDQPLVTVVNVDSPEVTVSVIGQ
jgi:hypothetical protein